MVTTECAIAEGTLSRWQGNDQRKPDAWPATPCRRDCVARRIA
jgi:hypothetical protein